MSLRNAAVLATIALAAATLAPPPPAIAQSFDCRKAGTPTEHAICKSLTLSALDTELSRVFQGALAAEGASGERRIRDAQRAWVTKRDACAAKEGCIRAAYLQRIRALWNTHDSQADWPGSYDGPFGQNEITITAPSAGTLHAQFAGAGASYTCGPVSGTIKTEGNRAHVMSDGKEVMAITRTGTGFFLPRNETNTAMLQQTCGSLAPDVAGTFFAKQ